MCAINLKVIVSLPQSQLRGLIKSNQWGWWWQQLLNNYLKSTLFLSHTPLVYSWIVNTIRCSQSCIKQLVFTLYIKCALRQYYIIYNIQHCINTNYIYIFIKCSLRLGIFNLHQTTDFIEKSLLLAIWNISSRKQLFWEDNSFWYIINDYVPS